MRADIAAINRGLATRDGDLFTVNGRTYCVDGQDHTYPVQGLGFHRVDRATFKALQVLRTLGETPQADLQLRYEGYTVEQIEMARRLHRT